MASLLLCWRCSLHSIRVTVCAAELMGQFATSHTHQRRDRSNRLEPQPVQEWPQRPGEPGKQHSPVGLLGIEPTPSPRAGTRSQWAPGCTLAVARGPGVAFGGDVDIQITHLRLLYDPRCLYGLYCLLSSLNAPVMPFLPIPVAPLWARQ